MNPDTTASTRPSANLWKVFAIFLVIGLQSFGGGTATLYLLRQACRKQGWLGEEEFLKLWALSQITPGINLIKITLLIGKRLHGLAGMLAATGGLMLPSAVITALMTAGYAAIQDEPLVQAAMRGIIPATIGLTLALSWDLGAPLLARARRDGWVYLGMTLLLIVVAAGLFALAQVSPVVILLAAGGLAVAARAVPGRREAGKAP